MKQTDTRITVAIPTWNSAAYISQLLSYITQQGFYRIYVLDDASTDDTVEICKTFPDVEVIDGQQNLGPTRNRNRILTKDIGDILVFIDDDMQWRSGDLLPTVKQYFADPRLAALGFGVYDKQGKQLWFGNERESNPLFAWFRDPFITRISQAERQSSFFYVQWVLEGAFAIRSEHFKLMSGFDGHFKRYQEGPDICRRLRQHGFLIGYSNDIQFTHTKPLSVFTAASQAGRYLKSGAIWHVRHRGKVKPPVK